MRRENASVRMTLGSVVMGIVGLKLVTEPMCGKEEFAATWESTSSVRRTANRSFRAITRGGRYEAAIARLVRSFSLGTVLDETRRVEVAIPGDAVGGVVEVPTGVIVR